MEGTLEVEDKVATGVVDHDVGLVEDSDEVIIVFTSLWEQVDETEVTKWLHHHTVALELANTLAHAKEVVILSGNSTIVLNLCMLLHVPDEAALFRVARS